MHVRKAICGHPGKLKLSYIEINDDLFAPRGECGFTIACDSVASASDGYCYRIWIAVPNNTGKNVDIAYTKLIKKHIKDAEYLYIYCGDGTRSIIEFHEALHFVSYMFGRKLRAKIDEFKRETLVVMGVADDSDPAGDCGDDTDYH